MNLPKTTSFQRERRGQREGAKVVVIWGDPHWPCGSLEYGVTTGIFLGSTFRVWREPRRRVAEGLGKQGCFEQRFSIKPSLSAVGIKIRK